MTAPSSPPNILFVDDDPLVLQGLQRMLRPIRHEWTMFFVESGFKALELMASTPFHVLVSDMRMPGMNGAQLLTEVRNRYPKTIRLILSGHADREMILHCVGTAHQFLSKPCEPDAIRSAIARAAAFDSSIKSEQIKKLVVQMDRIPSIPSIFSEIVEKLRDDETPIDEISALVAQDLAITAKLLKLVNSAFFGLHRGISSPAEAVAYLGLETIKSLVLAVNAFSSLESAKIPGISLERLWEHSMAVGATARRIIEAENVPKIFAEESFLAGMLHDIGKLVMAVNLPQEYENALKHSRTERVPLYQAEEHIFGANHADVGGYVLSLWGLPARVVEAIAFHHDPEVSAATGLNPVIAVHVANHAVRTKELQSAPESQEGPGGELRSTFLASLSLEEKLPAWMNFAYDR
jgi:HD-like signal output (HDOD) protein/CheY-like chemotaxis protein